MPKTNINSLDFVHNFVDINTRIIWDLFMVTISASVHQYFIFFVFTRVEHVTAEKWKKRITVVREDENAPRKSTAYEGNYGIRISLTEIPPKI